VICSLNRFYKSVSNGKISVNLSQRLFIPQLFLERGVKLQVDLGKILGGNWDKVALK